MSNLDLAVIGLIYVLYTTECIHWLDRENISYTKAFSNNPRRYEYGPLSYTLLGRYPCMVNPLLLGEGFLTYARSSEVSSSFAQDLLKEVATSTQDKLSIMRILCWTLGVLMLVGIPVVICLHLLTYLWPQIILLVVPIHVAIVVFFGGVIGKWQKGRARFISIAAIATNTLASIRCIDSISRIAFNAKLEIRRH